MNDQKTEANKDGATSGLALATGSGLFSKDAPDKSTGYWCGDCGHAMRFNVPRMGPSGGFVHANTASLQCGDPVKTAAWQHAVAQTFQNEPALPEAGRNPTSTP